MPRSPLSSALALLCSTSLSFAQPTPAPDPEAPSPASVEPEDSASSPTASPAPATPTLPAVADPMLVPEPAPAFILGSWQQALRLVRTRSTNLASSLVQVERAAAQGRLALSRLHPTLTATGGVQQHLLFGRGTNITADGAQVNVELPDPSTLWNARLALRQPLLDLRARHDRATAEVSQRAASLRSEDVERLVLAAVADTIVSVVTAERLAEVSRVSLSSSLSTLDLTQRRARLGAGSALDVLRAEQEVTLNRAQVVNSDESLRRAREALGMALGYAEAWGVTPNVRLDQLGEDARRVCAPVANVEQRADVRAAKKDVEVAQRNTDSVDYALAPNLDFMSELNYTTSAFTPNGRPLQWTVGALLTIPLYDGGSRAAERQLASTEVELAQHAVTQARRQAELEVRQSLRSVRVAAQNLDVSRRARALAEETARLTQLSFLNGKGTSFELVDATRRHQQAELDLAVKEFEVVRARITALLALSNCDI